MAHLNKGRFKKFLEQTFIMFGSVIIIAMALIVALNFSRDSKLFAKNTGTLPKPSYKPVATQLPGDEEKENYGTLKYERQGFNPGDSTDNSNGISKELKDAKIEIINCSGKEKLGEEIKTVLMDIGINSVVNRAEDKSDVTGGETVENKVSENEPLPNDTIQTTPTGKSSEYTPLPTPNALKATPAAKSESISRSADRVTSGSAPQNTPEPTLRLTSAYTPVSTNTSGISTVSPEKAQATPDKSGNTSNNIISQTLIIERNDKGLGAEIKKIIKAGKIVKEASPGYDYDITIKIGTDYIP